MRLHYAGVLVTVRVEIGMDGDGLWYASLLDHGGCMGHGATPRAAIAEAVEIAADALELCLDEEMEFDIVAPRDA